VAMILPERKRVHSAPTAQPKREHTLAFKVGYWAGLELEPPNPYIDECCLRDQLDYRAGISRAHREIAKELQEYKLQQARERAAMRREEGARRRKRGHAKPSKNCRSRDCHDHVPDKNHRKRDKGLAKSGTSVINQVYRTTRLKYENEETRDGH